jgi:hypothetical protein
VDIEVDEEGVLMEQRLAGASLVEQLVGAGVPRGAAIRLQTRLSEGVRDTAKLLVAGHPSVEEAIERITIEAIEHFGALDISRPTRNIGLHVDNRDSAVVTGHIRITWSTVLPALVTALTTLQTELDPKQPVEVAVSVLALAVIAELAFVKSLMRREVTGNAAAVFWSLYERGTLDESRAVTLEVLLPHVNSHQHSVERSPMTIGDLRGALKPLQQTGCVGHLRVSDGSERWWLKDSVRVDIGHNDLPVSREPLTTLD